MTTDALESLLPVALDMSQHLPAQRRAQRLVDAARKTLGSDAVALLRVQGDELVPIAESGLSCPIPSTV